MDLLGRHYESFVAHATEKFFDMERQHHHQFLHDSRNLLAYLGDDVLFNSVSVLDYAGNLVGYLHGGEKVQKLKWNGVVRSARDGQNPLSRSMAAQEMLRLHDDWINRLHGVRSEIIHEVMELGTGKQDIFIKDNQITMTLQFQMPAKVVKRFAFLAASGGPVDLVKGTQEIGLRVIDSAVAVMIALSRDFEIGTQE